MPLSAQRNTLKESQRGNRTADLELAGHLFLLGGHQVAVVLRAQLRRARVVLGHRNRLRVSEAQTSERDPIAPGEAAGELTMAIMEGSRHNTRTRVDGDTPADNAFNHRTPRKLSHESTGTASLTHQGLVPLVQLAVHVDRLVHVALETRCTRVSRTERRRDRAQPSTKATGNTNGVSEANISPQSSSGQGKPGPHTGNYALWLGEAAHLLQQNGLGGLELLVQHRHLCRQGTPSSNSARSPVSQKQLPKRLGLSSSETSRNSGRNQGSKTQQNRTLARTR